MTKQHQLVKNEDSLHFPWVCKICTWHWAAKPNTSCPGVPRYDGVPPENLKFESELRRAGLKLKPDAQVKGCWYNFNNHTYYWLYDVADTVPGRKATPAQLAALEKARKKVEEKRYTCHRCHRVTNEILNYSEAGKWHHELCIACFDERERRRQERFEAMLVADQQEAVEWAAEKLAHPGEWVILDTETTGLDRSDEIIQIAIIRAAIAPGEEGPVVLLDTLVKPKGEVSEGARVIHHITDEALAAAPTWPEVYQQVKEIMKDRTIISYGVDFDRRMLYQTCHLYDLETPEAIDWDCMKEVYAQFYGDWHDYYRSYRWQPLPGGNHSALGDCLAALKLMEDIAKTKVEVASANGS